jgi:hypothetical protein
VKVDPNDVPKPVIDEPPNKVDMKFMKKARKAAEKSDDESTKVINMYYVLMFQKI